MVAEAGMDPIRFMETKDAMERDAMIEIAAVIFERRKMHDRNLAIEIAQQVGKVFGGR